ncbi:unnamed protein product [Schistocephalus solidus]|uniref:C2H2-type domain-containing protein n=1 Tax=Schistocephalus solidus TaxID=70667 RepID=A0A183TD32_SCHSO|nr:unnamed protein product [Schistocephalus solidus]
MGTFSISRQLCTLLLVPLTHDTQEALEVEFMKSLQRPTGTAQRRAKASKAPELQHKPDAEYNQPGWFGVDWAVSQQPSRSLAFGPQSPTVQPPSLPDPANHPHLLAPFNPWMRGLHKASLFFSLLQSLDYGPEGYPDPETVLDLSCKRESPTILGVTEQSPAMSCASALPSRVQTPSREHPLVCNRPTASSPSYREQQPPPPPPPPPPRSSSRPSHINHMTPLDPPNHLPNGTPEGPYVGASTTVETATPDGWNALALPYYPCPLLPSAELFNFLPLTLDQNMTCPFCRKAFRFEKNLLRHLQKTHATGNGESILKCKLCSYTTRHYSNIRVFGYPSQDQNSSFAPKACSGAVVPPVQSKPCLIYCDQYRDKPYTCSGCGAAFTQGSSLKLHIKSRHNDNLALFSLSRKPGKNNLTKLWTRVLKKDLPKYEAVKFNSIFASYYRLNYYHMLASTSSSQSRLAGGQPFPSLQSGSQPENDSNPLLSQFLPFALATPSLPDLNTPLKTNQSAADESISPDVTVSTSDSYPLDASTALRPLQDRSLLSSSSSSSPASSFMVRSLTDELPPSDGETSNGTRCAPAATPTTEAVDFACGITPGALYDAIMSNPAAFQPSKLKVEKLFRRTP